MTHQKEIERLRFELDKAKEQLQQTEFFVNWLESKIKVLEIKKVIEGKE